MEHQDFLIKANKKKVHILPVPNGVAFVAKIINMNNPVNWSRTNLLHGDSIE